MNNYRKNAGVVVFNKDKKVLMCKRVGGGVENPNGGKPWQFPQGGIDEGESPQDAAVRELFEETGIKSAKLIKTLDEPITYDLPEEACKILRARGCLDIGQAQYWSLFYFFGDDAEIRFDCFAEEIEFCDYKWVDIDEAPSLVWEPKQEAYKKMVAIFKPLIEKFSID